MDSAKRKLPVRMGHFLRELSEASGSVPDAPLTSGKKKKPPIRMSQFMSEFASAAAPASRQSCFGTMKSGIQSGPSRLVRRNIETVYDHPVVQPKSAKQAVQRQHKTAVKRHQQPLREDANVTLGILPLLSPCLSVGEPVEKKCRTLQASKEEGVMRGRNLRELAMQKSMLDKKQIRVDASASSKIKTQILVPSMPRCVEQPAKVPMLMRRKFGIQSKPSSTNCTATNDYSNSNGSEASNVPPPIKSCTQSEELKENQLPEKNNSPDAHRFDLVEPQVSTKLVTNHTLSNLEDNAKMTVLMSNDSPSFPFNTIIQPENYLRRPSAGFVTAENKILNSEPQYEVNAVNQFTPGIEEASIPPRSRTSNLDFHPYELQLNTLEMDLASNAKYQQRCHSELQVVYNKQLEIETELQRLKYQHNIVYNKRFELETEMQNLKSEYGEKHNEYMSLCRTITKTQSKFNFPGILTKDNVSVPSMCQTNLSSELTQLGKSVKSSEGIASQSRNKNELISTDQSIDSDLLKAISETETNEESVDQSKKSDEVNCTEIETNIENSDQSEKPGLVNSFVAIQTNIENPDESLKSDLNCIITETNLENAEVATDSVLPSTSSVPNIEVVPATPRRSLRLISQSSISSANVDQLTKQVDSSGSISKGTPQKSRRLSRSTENISFGVDPCTSVQHTLDNSAISKKGEKSTITESADEIASDEICTDAAENVSVIAPSTFYGGNKSDRDRRTSLRRSRTFVMDSTLRESLPVGSKSTRKSISQNRRSVIDYRQLQTSFRGLLETPMKTPVHKSAKKQSLCPMDTPSNISRRVQASLELLLDSPN